MKRAIGGITAAILLVLTLPPLAFAAGRGGVTWPRLAEIGEAYGGVAAIISALALVGVTASLLLQWRQTRLAQLFALREHHFELMRLGLEHPGMLILTDQPEGPNDGRAAWYANMWIAFWALEWDLGIRSEAQLRIAVGPIFRFNPAVVEWWRAVAPTWSTRPTARRRRFEAIVTQECERAANDSGG